MTRLLTMAAAALLMSSAAHAQLPGTSGAQPGLPTLGGQAPLPAPSVQPLPSSPVVNTPRGPDVSVGGTSSYQQLSGPNGASGIITPNSNGTSTIIGPTGGSQVVPTQR